MQAGWYDRRVRRVRDLSSGDVRVYLEIEIRRVQCRRCGRVKRERLEWLADNPFYTKRFAHYVGRRCREGTIQGIAQELHLDWDTVKTLDKQYMRAQLAKAGTPGPRAIGIDEISIRKGHTYRIVVSDLIRRRPIWFGGEDRSEASMIQFYDWLGDKKSRRIRLAVMDMWKPFRKSSCAAGRGPVHKFHKWEKRSTRLSTRASAARTAATSQYTLCIGLTLEGRQRSAHAANKNGVSTQRILRSTRT